MKKVIESKSNEIEIPDIEKVRKITAEAWDRAKELERNKLYVEVIKYNKLLITEIENASKVGYFECCIHDVPEYICDELSKLYTTKGYICKSSEEQFRLAWLKN